MLMFKVNIQTRLIVVLLSVVMLLTGCDTIDKDERYVELPAIEAQRVVLLEEFTGQECVNCPTAHKVIESLQEQYGSSLISVSIHAGNFAKGEGSYGDYFQGLKTSDGDTYASMWGISSYPSGVVNRTSGILNHDAWAAEIRKELAKPSNVDIVLNASLENNTISVSADVQAYTPIEASLQLWVVEDGIVSIQYDGNTVLADYVHNNVYRASVNGIGGESFSVGANQSKTLSGSIALRDFWKSENLSVVAFVYDRNGVLQATKTKLIK